VEMVKFCVILHGFHDRKPMRLGACATFINRNLFVTISIVCAKH